MKKHILLIALAFFITLSNAQIVISELHYNPADEETIDGDNLEFIELTNTGDSDIDISGYSFLEGITYVFPISSTINAGQSIVLAKSQTIFESFYGITAFGEYTGGLKNSGEEIELIDGSLNTISSVTYSDDSPWSVLADGLGYSLELTDIDNVDSYESWHASSTYGGSPGEFDTESETADYPIIINEILANTDDLEKIELYNSSDSSINIGTWYLTDNKKSPYKYQFRPDTYIEANSYLVLTSDDFGNDFGLSNEGEEVYILSAELGILSGYSDGFSFNISSSDQSYGTHTTSEGTVITFNLTTQTFGTANDEPVVGPLVITDIMYNPSTDLDEFIIIRNISDTAVSSNSPYLTDSNAIKVNGVGFEFDFTNPYTFEPDESFFLTSIDPESFRTKYSISNDLNIFQYTGTLNNGSDLLEIEIPMKRDIDTSSLGVITFDNHYKTLDEVEYNDNTPWPTDADGLGTYLHRQDRNIYANDPEIWTSISDPLSTVLATNTTLNSSSTYLFPNPTTDLLNIGSNEEISSYNITTIDGSPISSGNFSESVDVSSLKAGLYIIQLNTLDTSINKRFVKE